MTRDRGSRDKGIEDRDPQASGARSPFTALLAGHAIFLLAFALTLSPQFLTYQALNGRPRPSSTVEGKLDFLSPHLLDTLIDPQHGAFLWSPILMLGLVGMIWLWRRDRLLAALLLLGFVAQTYINGAISTWHLTGSFGFRRLIECTADLRPRAGGAPGVAATTPRALAAAGRRTGC